jgi:hypothetical protein
MNASKQNTLETSLSRKDKDNGSDAMLAARAIEMLTKRANELKEEQKNLTVKPSESAQVIASHNKSSKFCIDN